MRASTHRAPSFSCTQIVLTGYPSEDTLILILLRNLHEACSDRCSGPMCQYTCDGCCDIEMLVSREGRCPGGPAQITSDTVRSAEARPGLDHGQDGGRMPASWPSLHGSLSPPITPGYQHTWTCTCVRSTPDPRPSLSNDHPPPSQLPWGCSVTSRADVYIWNNSVPASLYSHRCHYYPSLEDRMWPRGDLSQH